MAHKKRGKLFTDSDLDGVGCLLIGQGYFNWKEDRLDAVQTQVTQVSGLVTEFLSSGEVDNYDVLYITDMGVDKETAELIEKVNRMGSIEIKLFDHHETALWLADTYTWATVLKYEPEEDKDEGRTRLTCATRVFEQYLISKYGHMSTRSSVLVEMIRKYDTWEWSTHYLDSQPKDLNDVYRLYGADHFIKKMRNYLECLTNAILTGRDYELLNLEQSRFDKYVEEKVKQVRLAIIDGIPSGVLFAEGKDASYLGHAILDEPMFKLAVIVDVGANRLSFRSRGDEVNCAELASRYPGGGGHFNAAGAPIDPEIVLNFIHEVC